MEGERDMGFEAPMKPQDPLELGRSVSRRETMRARGSSGWALWVLALCAGAAAQVLTPPYFNLAENRRITATATCGLDVSDPELYCKLVGANADRGASFSDDLIQGGQVSSGPGAS